MQRRSANSDSGRAPLVIRSVSWIGSLGILSGGIVFAPSEPTRAQVDPSIAKAKPDLRGVPAESVFEAPPAPSYPVKVPIVEPEYVEPEYVAPDPVEPAYVEPEYVEPAYVEPAYTEEALTPEGHSYIDTTDYSLGATTAYDEPPDVVLSERSTGCAATVTAGAEVPGSVCATPAPTQATLQTKPVQTSATATAAPPQGGEPVAVAQLEVPIPYTPAAIAGVEAVEYPAAVFGSYPVSAVPEIDFSAILGAGGFIPKPGEDSAQIYNSYYNVAAQALRDRSIRPQDLVAQVSSRLIFPLSIPAPITSAFGWRMHPVLGTPRMHTGTDIGAPMGTPVVAALAGQVAISDFLGGYGLTVVLEHEKGTEETLYAHLSEVFVKAGETVKQGDPIGRVGSTGLSTGPHLHFEMRKLTKEGWVNLDPGRQLEYGLAQLVRNLRMAENKPARPGSVPNVAPNAQGDEGDVLGEVPGSETPEETVAEVPTSW
ncbi:MAG: peptidoglycan DD-metalloendopeptidase family protein [Cyanobacteriota bacterium]|nr:peptidoglycan DD-metalloendopeptidase family protein [Cyanobacteriota bacterium]